MGLAISKYDTTWTTTQQERLGAGQVDALGGRIFHYAEADATGIARGKLAVSETVVGQHVNLSFQTAPAANATSAKVTLGSTALTADYYKDGWLVVQDGTGEGRAYPIEGHAAADASATGTFQLKEGIDTAGALSETNVDLIANLYKSIQISVSDQADTVVGVPIVTGTASRFGWVQTWGMCSVLMDETVAVGAEVVVGESVAGAVQTSDGVAEGRVGIMGAQAGVDTEYQLVFLKLDANPYNSG
jgi:hypothetical protein